MAGGAAGVSLLDGSAGGVVDSLRKACGEALEGLARDMQAKRDSLRAGGAALGEEIARAEARLKAENARYAAAFQGMERFRSFGGNPIFSDADLELATETLLQEIADRFHRGRAFSLETEAEVRRFVRSRLVPEERRVQRARSEVARLRRSGRGNAADLEALAAAYALKREALREGANREILARLQARVLRRAPVDSTGFYRFTRLPAGGYHLYVPEGLPKGWLLPVALRSHTRQDLAEGNRRLLLVAEEPASDTGE